MIAEGKYAGPGLAGLGVAPSDGAAIKVEFAANQ